VGRIEFREDTSIVNIFPEYEELLDGIEAFSHILVLFWPHKLDTKSRRVRKVHPRRIKSIPKQGVFATRSPARPNPVLITEVQLVKREGPKLWIKGFDGLDESPVIDIKPVTRRHEYKEGFKVPDWMELVRAAGDSSG
jgi:tRNA-Thr(GGU) m(6)t(6)A37 methyltransferase TsaA